MPIPASNLEHLYSAREVSAAGFGHRATIMKRIRDKEVPAVLVGNAYKIRESDLHLLAVPIGAPRPAAEDTLGDLVKDLVAAFPRLTADQKSAIAGLLIPTQ